MLQDNYLTAEDVSRLLHVKLSTVRAWTSRRRIPCVKLAGGRAVRYRERDIKAIIKAVPASRPLSTRDDCSGGGA